MAFVSSPSISTASTQVSTANLSDDTIYASLASQPNGSQLIHEDLEQIHEDDLKEMDLKWQLSLLSMRTRRGTKNQDSMNRNQDSFRRTVNVEETSSKAMLAIDGAGFDWPKFEGYGPKPSKSVSEDTSNKIKESPDTSLVIELVSDDNLKKKTVFPTVAKIEFVRAKQQEKPVRELVKYVEMYRSQDPRGNQRNWNNQKSQQLGSDFVMYNKACFICGSFDHVQANCNYHQRERVVSGNNYTRVNYNYSAKKTHPNAQRNMVPRAVLMKTGLRSLNTVRPVNTAHPKTIVNAVKASACWVWRPTKLNSASITLKKHNYVDARGRSKHMTWNMSYLSGFKEFNGGYVTFRGGAKGEQINGKGTLKTGKLDFEDVYFDEELQFNLFSVSQMCDKKNSVFFTDIVCFILSPDFKLADESQVLLKVP
ncbi:hypothetical protein Tco_1257131 [Tanacetum coccineum]